MAPVAVEADDLAQRDDRHRLALSPFPAVGMRIPARDSLDGGVEARTREAGGPGRLLLVLVVVRGIAERLGGEGGQGEELALEAGGRRASGENQPDWFAEDVVAFQGPVELGRHHAPGHQSIADEGPEADRSLGGPGVLHGLHPDDDRLLGAGEGDVGRGH